MRRTFVVLLGPVLALLACGGSTTVTTRATTTSTLSPATTTVSGGPVAIPESAILKLGAGAAYRSDAFWIPIAIAPIDEGWWSVGATELWLYLQWHDGDSSLFDLDLVVLAHAPDAAVPDVVAGIIGDEAVVVTAEPSAATVAGWEGRVVDIVVPGEVDEQEEREFRGHARSIAALQGLTLYVESDPTSSGGSATATFGFGVRYGRQARIWVLDVDGETITVVAAAADPEAFEALAPVADRLVAGIDFAP